MEISKCWQTDSNPRANRIIACALLFDNEVVIGFAACDPLDHAIIEGQIVVTRGLDEGGMRIARHRRYGVSAVERRQRSKQQQCRDQSEERPSRPATPASETVPARRITRAGAGQPIHPCIVAAHAASPPATAAKA